jgi:RimJ/RimL family protein N-acetyltransferase
LDLDGVAEFHFFFLPQYWGQGYGTEAARGLLAYLWENESGLKKVRSIHDGDNLVSQKIAEKLGMERIDWKSKLPKGVELPDDLPEPVIFELGNPKNN